MNDKVWRRPDWELPEGVGAAISTREGGVSDGKYGSLNLSHKVGDDDGAVGENRIRFQSALSGVRRLVWLTQVHGMGVVAAHDFIGDEEANPEADASWTDQPGIGCVITVADCVPILIAADDGSKVAAVHAGWRGMAERVIAATAKEFRPGEFTAYVGPCIDVGSYEVGGDVIDALSANDHDPEHFRADGSGKFLVDLAGIAVSQLVRCGARRVACANEDTFARRELFSARRDGPESGRFAAAIWIAE